MEHVRFEAVAIQEIDVPVDHLDAASWRDTIRTRVVDRHTASVARFAKSCGTRPA
jgi:hypothetical protein